MAEAANARRVIQVNQNLVGPTEPRRKTLKTKKLSDYPNVAPAHLHLAKKLSSPLLTGPPICDELIAFVEHTFTEEEAGVARHLGTMAGRSARAVARAEHRPLEEVEPILDRLAFQKRAIACDGPQENAATS